MYLRATDTTSRRFGLDQAVASRLTALHVQISWPARLGSSSLPVQTAQPVESFVGRLAGLKLLRRA